MISRFFPGRYESLEEIAEFVRSIAQAAGLSPFETYKLETAVDEACSNIIEHAYCGISDGVIEFTILTTPEAITIILKDNGRKFSPDSVLPPDVNAPLKKRKDHGLGIFIIRKWMDDVQFDYIDGHNILTMTKYRDCTPDEPCSSF